MNATTIHRSTKGFITIELLMAFVLGTLFLSAAIMLTLGIPGEATRFNLSGNAHMAIDTISDRDVQTYLTHMSESNASFHLLSTKAGESIETRHGVTYSLSPHFISPCSAILETNADWTTTNDRVRHTGQSDIVTSPDIARAFGNSSCDPLPPSSWRNPVRGLGETVAGDIVGAPTAFSYLPINDTPHLIVGTTNGVQGNDIWVIDVHNNSSPTLVSSLETGDETHTAGLLDVVTVSRPEGSFVYALQNSGTNQLVVIEISDPALPTLVHTKSFEPYGVSPSGSNPEGRVITHYGNRLYIGLRTTVGPEFLVFDIENDPRNPRFVGSLPNSFDHSIYDIVTNGEYVFLAIKPGSPPSGLPTRELMVIDVRTTPRDTGGGWNATSTPNDTEGAMSLYLIGNRLYMGRERVSNASERDFYVFDVSSTTKPTYVKSRRLGLPTTSLQGTPRVLDIIVQDTLAFVATTDPARSLQVYDILRDASTIVPVERACVTALALPRLTKLFYRNNLLYTLFGITAQVGIITDNTSLCAT